MPELNDNLSHAALKSLVSMLDEENPALLIEIYDNILKVGLEALPILKEQYYNTLGTVMHERLFDLISEINFLSIEKEMIRWKHSENHDLIHFLEILNNLFQKQPGQHLVEKYLNPLRQSIWIELNKNLTPLETIKLVNHIFFQVHKIETDNSEDFKSNIVFFQSRRSKEKLHPIVFLSLYLGVCQRLSLPVNFVDIPGGYILCYTANNKPVCNHAGSDVLFYISPVDKGLSFDGKQLRQFLESINISGRPDYFIPRTNIQLAQRFMHEIKIVFERKNDLLNMRFMGRLAQVLDKSDNV